MPLRFERKSVDAVASTADSLIQAAEKLRQVAADMKQHGMEGAFFPWTQNQWSCFDVVITLANQCAMVLPEQILAKDENRTSKYKPKQKKAEQKVLAEESSVAAIPPKRRGRRKKSLV